MRSPTRFREYVLELQRHVKLLSNCDLLRHLPAGGIQELLGHVHLRHVGAGEILFRAGDPGDALYIVANGRVEVLQAPQADTSGERPIAELEEGKAFGEMALLSGAPRTATVRAETDVELVKIEKEDFDRLLANDHFLSLEQNSRAWRPFLFR